MRAKNLTSFVFTVAFSYAYNINGDTHPSATPMSTPSTSGRTLGSQDCAEAGPESNSAGRHPIRSTARKPQRRWDQNALW